MPKNIEIKAKISNLKVYQQKLEHLKIKETCEIFQEDTFFKIENGRLKLRIFLEDKGELIYYSRSDTSGPKRSDYYIYETDNPEKLKKLLEISLGIQGVVRKKRLLYLVENTRIHLDEVEELGSFLELEVVLNPEQNENEGIAIANDLMLKLGINKKDLIDKAYIDLIEKST